MYYLNEDGKRVYTLKVRLFLILLAFVWISLFYLSLLLSLFHKNKLRGSNSFSDTIFFSLFSPRRPQN